MDLFKKNRTRLGIIIVLVILNVATMLMLWIGKPHADGPPMSPKNNQKHFQQLMQDELGFDAAQIDTYLQLRQKHRQQAEQMEMELRHMKKQMFDEVLQETPQLLLSDSLLQLTQEKQAQLEQLTYQHLLDLKKLCTPEQQKELRILIGEVFQNGPEGTPPTPSQAPPPGEHPPGDHPRRPPQH